MRILGHTERSVQRLVFGPKQGLASDHPSGGGLQSEKTSCVSSWAGNYLESSGKSSVLGKAHGKAGMWVKFTSLTGPAGDPVPDDDLPTGKGEHVPAFAGDRDPDGGLSPL